MTQTKIDNLRIEADRAKRDCDPDGDRLHELLDAYEDGDELLSELRGKGIDTVDELRKHFEEFDQKGEDLDRVKRVVERAIADLEALNKKPSAKFGEIRDALREAIK